jgi:hypothetical protein
VRELDGTRSRSAHQKQAVQAILVNERQRETESRVVDEDSFWQKWLADPGASLASAAFPVAQLITGSDDDKDDDKNGHGHSLRLDYR